MPKVSRESASQANDYGPISERREDVEGTAIQFLTTNVDLDATPFHEGAARRPLLIAALGLCVQGPSDLRLWQS
jgi:hypothetical protein